MEHKDMPAVRGRERMGWDPGMGSGDGGGGAGGEKMKGEKENTTMLETEARELFSKLAKKV